MIDSFERLSPQHQMGNPIFYMKPGTSNGLTLSTFSINRVAEVRWMVSISLAFFARIVNAFGSVDLFSDQRSIPVEPDPYHWPKGRRRECHGAALPVGERKN